MRVLVCGGRDFEDVRFLLKVLDRVHAKHYIRMLIHGDAKGADRLGRDWARSRNVPIETYPADWRKDGKAAGPIRNQRMLAEGRPDAVVAFRGGNGTAHMVRIAQKAGIKIYDVRELS